MIRATRLVSIGLLALALNWMAITAHADTDGGVSTVVHNDNVTLAEQILARRHVDDLPAIKKRKVLRVLVTYSRTDFFFSSDGKPRGLQVEYLREYEKWLNKGVEREEEKIRVKFIPTSFDRLLTDLLEGRGDVAAAMLTITPERQKSVAFATSAGFRVDELLVVNKQVTDIESLEDLAGRSIYVLAGSSYVEHLHELNRDFEKQGLKPMEIREADSHLLSEDILELVNSGAVDITVVDDYKAELWARVLPAIRVLKEIKVKSGMSIGWAVRPRNPELRKSLNAFAKTVKKGTLMGNMLFKRYYGNTKWIKNPIAHDERSKLRRMIGLFKKYASQYGFEYLKVVAQAYQESGLDQSKRSHRGAVGVMQLLPSTAADPNVAIKDIEELENNVQAGMKYLAFLRDRYFRDPAISREDRVAFSWAAYNAGPGRVRRMRSMAKEMGLDPNVWFSNVELAAGKIVGRETVQYVRNIFTYYVAYTLVRERIE